MKISRVYLDMDGVLVDFLGGLHKALGLPFDINCYPYELGKWDMLEDTGYPFSIVNAMCTEDFWAGLKWMHDGLDILNVVLSYFSASDVYLLSSPMLSSGSWTGKFKWVKQNIPGFERRLIVTGAPKSIFATPNSLLIDDRPTNIFNFEAAGGKTIIVPRPWGCYDDSITAIDHVRRGLEVLCGS
jgi:5'(3')-deoxyribonucleotidase